MAKAKDYRICSKCGEEYNAFRKHECSPRVLAEIERDARADAEVRMKGR